MNRRSAPTTQPSLSNRLKNRIRSPFRSRSLAPSSSPSSSLSPASTSSAVLAAADPTTASAGRPVSRQVTSQPSDNHGIFSQAVQLLSEGDRNVLQDYIPSHASDITLALQQALTATIEKQRECHEKRWKFTFNGRSVSLKEKADKVILWLDRFKAVGDVAVNADPVHAGLPWAGIRLLLEAATSEVNQMASLLVGCETVLYLANRLRAYMDFMAILPATLTKDNFEHAVAKMYSCILHFLAQAIQVYTKSTTHRALSALWQMSDVQDFESKCDRLGVRVEIEANNCDRTLSAQDREDVVQLQKNLRTTLEELRQHHSVQESIDRLGSKIDLDKLPYAAGAIFQSFSDSEVYTTCHPATRVDLLRQVQDWARQRDGKHIFWLNGMAGTGKSTISRTVAKWLTDHGCHQCLDLGASFFFKRGESDRGSALRFFSTITRQLVSKLPELRKPIAEVIDSDPFICDKSPSEQFKKLIYQPLQKIQLTANNISTFVVVVDALDECENDKEVEMILQLWSSLAEITHIRLRLFLTSRPDLPVRLGFKKMSIDTHEDLILHEVPQAIVEHDISVFLKDEFSKIRNSYNDDPLSGIPLDNDWPSEDVLQLLTGRAVPLFIVAMTVCRYVGDPSPDPRGALEDILKFQGMGEMSQMEQTYLPVLKRLLTRSSDSYKQEILCRDFKMIIGSIVVLANPLSVASLQALLEMSAASINFLLRPLYSVLHVPIDFETPVRPLHLSFGEFLLSDKLRDHPLGVDGATTHQMLLTRCLALLSSSHGLREDICDLEYPGRLRQEIDSSTIRERLSPALQYACRYWVHHAQQSEISPLDNGEVHEFLQKHFLHWFEALSLLNASATAIDYVGTLQLLSCSENSIKLSSFLEDARRFVLANRNIADLAPLQLYSSAVVFAPRNSIIRNVCGRIPAWIHHAPMTSATWGPELQKLEGHTHRVTAVSFSHDGLLLASVSYDRTVRLWNPRTGQEVQKLEGHTGGVEAVSFSHNSLLLASASWDSIVRLWNPKTGQEVQKLEGHTSGVKAVSFSHDSLLLASASWDSTVRLWNPKTGQEVQKLEGHTSGVEAVSFSPDGSLLASVSWDRTVRLWNPKIRQEVQKLEGHTDRVEAVSFSPDGSLLASASYDRTVRLWNPKTGQEVQKLEGYTGGVTAVCFSLDGSLLASALWDRTVRLWNLVGQEVQKLEGHTQVVSAVSFSLDGSLLASASWDETVRLWNPGTGQEVQKLEGHTDAVSVVSFALDGSLLASASEDNTVRLWNPKTGQEVQKLEGLPRVETISPASDNMTWSTNLGVLSTDKGHGFIKDSEYSIKNKNTTILDGDWIQQDSRNLLWLPQDYRGSCSANYGNLVAIGQRSGQIDFFDLAYSKRS